MADCKVVQFRNKRAELKKEFERLKIIENAHFLIDECKGDFAIVFKTKDIEHLFDGIENKNFIVAISDVDKINIDSDDYFFTGFYNRQYFNLNS